MMDVLERMEDSDLDSWMRSKNYTLIISSLNNPGVLDKEIGDRILVICTKDLKENLQYSSSAIIIISNILKRIKEGKGECSASTLLQSALTLVQATKKLMLKPILRQLSFDTLILYPDEILLDLVSLHSADILDLMSYNSLAQHIEVLALVSRFINKLLVILPPEKNLIFVHAGLNVWFNVVMPTVMLACSSDDADLKEYILLLELIMNSLKQIDYSNNIHWKIVLEKICDANGYPLILKNMLERGNNNWHIMWKICIILLKDQITKVNKTGISPINAMLPVVELAFKLDPKSRCQAFECWDAVIDNFSTELNEAMVNKRLKLLMIPLKLNNAKVEETVLAKFNTWWYLIRRFYSKMDKYTDFVLIPFIHFCFGKPDVVKIVGGKPVAVPGQMTEALSQKCVEVLVEIVGHVDSCACCTLPSAGGRLISTKLLVEQWNLWVHCLQTAIKTAAKKYEELVLKKLTCLWRGIVTVIGELPENQIRADLFIELLKFVESLLELCQTNDRMADIIYMFITTLTTEQKFRPLLKTKNGPGPMHLVLRIIQNSAMGTCYTRIQSLDSKIHNLKPIAAIMMDSLLVDCDELMQYYRSNSFENKLMLWAALVEVVLQSECFKPTPAIVDLVLWPTHKNNYSTISKEISGEIWYKWYKLYNHVHQFLFPHHIKDIKYALLSDYDYKSNPYYRLCASMVTLKQQILADQLIREHDAYTLLTALNGLTMEIDVGPLDKYFPILTDILSLLLTKAARIFIVDLIIISIKIVQATFKLANASLKGSCDTQKPIFIDNLQDSFRRFLDKIGKIDAIASLKPEIETAYKLKAEVDHTVASKWNVSKANDKSNSNVNKSSEIKKSIEESKDTNNTDSSTPEPKSAKKIKSNKKLDIVNKVVENGEEFVIVKSHWKFNPKKLTENQKEKLKRKREDIPALYQDLSQSQDEFKLKSWKTDSQDPTTSKSESNSKSNGDFAGILNIQLPGTEVVPNIIQNIFHDNANKNNEIQTVNSDNDNNNKLQKTPTTKKPKTPRLGLTDRVLKNVKNLIKKSQSDNDAINQVTENINQTVNENAFKTPEIKAKPVENLVNSAPPKISSIRPTRSIKKPKKFEGAEVFPLKRKRLVSSDTQQDDKTSDKGEVPHCPVTTVTKQNNKNEELSNINKEAIEHAKEYRNDELPAPSEDYAVLEAPTLQPFTPQVDISEASQTNVNDNIECNSEIDNYNVVPEKSATQDVVQDVVTQENPIEEDNDNSQVIEEDTTPRPEKTKKKDGDPSTIKKKRSRIEKQLLIDMVEGHPVLQQSPYEKRVTRKNLTNDANNTVSKRRKSLIEKSNKIKAELVNATTDDERPKQKTKPTSKSPSPKSQSPKARTRKTHTLTTADQEASSQTNDLINYTPTEQEADSQTVDLINCTPADQEVHSQTVNLINSQEQSSDSQEEMPMSEDVIESSQDSTLTTISVKSATKKKAPVLSLDKEGSLQKTNKVTETQKLIDDDQNEVIPLSDTLEISSNQGENEDIELPKNKTLPEHNAEADLTDNMDTKTFISMDSSSEVIVIDDLQTPIVVNTEGTVVGKETQEMAEADTLPMEVESQSIPPTSGEDANVILSELTSETEVPNIDIIDNDITDVPSQEDITPNLSKTTEVITDLIVESSNSGSPLKDEVQRKKEFLNDTIEISPIKTLSPVREKKSPSPETSSDYVVIKLTSPVQSNGEPYSEKCDSPEVFTEDKVSPDKRDQSPPRKPAVTTNNSPSSSLSLKKNRPQMRFNRAAQMLGLCVPENILNIDRSENDENKKSNPVSTPAKRNLKRFYNAGGENNENNTNENENEESENFLKFTRPLPPAESSPCNPILKRKLAEIADEATVSPASKRKRVSFHDPPVSTTVAVQKYIEPCGVRSPSNSAIKRQERQFQALTNAKSPKRLENVFRLETVLTKAVESFSDENTISNDTEMSLDETPAAEVVKTSELNDTDPICPELLDCMDPIENIAGELSSTSTKALLIKELVGKVETIADLAKMTELEVNRLCIKAPKVKIARKVLSKYASERAKSEEITPVAVVSFSPTEVPVIVPEVEKVNAEAQTNEVLTKNSEMQTLDVPKIFAHTQTDATPTTHCSSQTNESGAKSTKDIVTTCIKERPDFIDQLTMQLQHSSIRHLAERLPFDDCLSLLKNKMTAFNSSEALNEVIARTAYYNSTESECMDLNILREHLCNRFDSKVLILFCSELLKKIYES